MREILFRGKRIDNDEWEEGFYVRMHDSKGRVAHKIHSGYTDNIYGNFYSDDLSPEGVEVDPSTVGQFTGLCDKNGVRIFEGDIVAIEQGWNDTVKYCVIFDPQICGFIGDSINYLGFTTFEDDRMNIEVIGNIHDNPELLEGEG